MVYIRVVGEEINHKEKQRITRIGEARGSKIMQPSNALLRFHQEVCPDVPLDSPEIFYRLIEEIIRFKREKE